MISQRQIQFRREVRSRMEGRYNGYCHVFIVCALGAALFYVYIGHIHNVTFLEWLTVPFFFLLANMVEWYTHKYVMHRPMSLRGLRTLYQRHLLMHHPFFTDEEPRFRDHRDWRVTLFPPYVLVLFMLLALPTAAFYGAILTPNVGWLFMCVATTMYFMYEFMHFCCHADENWFVRNCPFVNTARRHHTAHHNSRLMMEVNMNVTFPISDWLFGTSDLDRGLLGHLLNGYDTRFLKKNVRVRARRPDEVSATLVDPDYVPEPGAASATAQLPAAPNQLEILLSVVALLVGAVLAYWGGSPVRPEYSNFIMITATFMAASIWFMPEPAMKKKAQGARVALTQQGM